MLQVLCAEQQELASGAEDVTELLFFFLMELGYGSGIVTASINYKKHFF